MSDDLVKRLQEATPDECGNESLCIEAAERIEKLEAERHMFVEALVEAAIIRGEAEGKLLASETYGILNGWVEKSAALEAKLAKAVRLIDLAVELAQWDLNQKLRDDMIGFATEIKGESH